MIILIFQGTGILYTSFNPVGCAACHRNPYVKISDTFFIIGGYYYSSKLEPVLLGIDTNLNVKWIYAFNHNLSNASVDQIVKINDTLIGVSGGHGYQEYFAGDRCPNRDCAFFGIFNLKNKNFSWVKYRQGYIHSWYMSARTITFDGQYLVIGFQGTEEGFYAHFVKVDLNGNIMGERTISVGSFSTVMDIVFDGSGYVALMYRADSVKPYLLKFDLNWNLLWAKKYNFLPDTNNYVPIKLLKDNDGFIIVGAVCSKSDGQSCSPLMSPTDRMLAFKTDLNGNILWTKIYDINTFGDKRAYDVNIDFDGNYLISGFMRTDLSHSYPIIIKVNRSNGNLIWSRGVLPPINNTSYKAQGIIPLGSGRFYLLVSIGDSIRFDDFTGFAIVKEDTTSINNCTKNIQVIQSAAPVNVINIFPSISLKSTTFYDATFSPYNLSLSFVSCITTPLGNSEGCDDGIKLSLKNKGIEISYNKDIPFEIQIYDIRGNLIRKSIVKKGSNFINLKQKGVFLLGYKGKTLKVVMR